MAASDAISLLRTLARSSDVVQWTALGGFGVALPRLSRAVASSERARDHAYAILGFSVFVPLFVRVFESTENLWSLFIYREAFGVEVTVPDLLAILLFVANRRRGQHLSFAGPLALPRAFYLAAMVVSVFASASPVQSLFSVSKLLRAYFTFGVLVVGFREIEAVRACTRGLAVGAALQGLLALLQRFAWHVPRPTGTLGSSNNLALTLEFIAPIAMSLIFAGRATRGTQLAALACAICPVIGQSRAGSAFFVLGATLVGLGSLARGISAAKLRSLRRFALAAAVPAALFAPKVLKRFETRIDWSWIERTRLSNVSKAMIQDHPWGVGANMFGWVMNHDGYGRRFDVNRGDRQLLVHNYYYLVTAELGWLGLVALAVLLASIAAAAIRAARLSGVRGDLGLGAAVAIGISSLHNWLEMSATARQPMYALWIVAALACALPTTRARHPASR